MVTEQLQGASVATKANVFFDGKCVSHTVTLANGEKKSVGVVLAATLTFNTAAAEIMECVAGLANTKWLAATNGKLRNLATVFSAGQLLV
jgi:purine/pyrimidine-nucleoside phosphorylase